MRWKPLSDRDMHPANWLWLWAPLIVLVLLLGPLFALEWIEGKKRKLMGPSKEWRPWFAWYPVTIPFEDAVWFEWIERRLQYGMTDYRTPQPAAKPQSTHG